MSHATPYAGKEIVFNGIKLFVGLFKWPVSDDQESYFAALMQVNSDGSWTTIVQLEPMPISPVTKGATATMNDILTVFNQKASTLATPSEIPWIERLKKLFDNVTVVDGKIVVG